MNYEKKNEPLNEVQREPCLDFIREAATDITIETRDFGDHIQIIKIKTKHIESTTKISLHKNCHLNEAYKKYILKLLGLAP
jgi:hypothetical protein